VSQASLVRQASTVATRGCWVVEVVQRAASRLALTVAGAYVGTAKRMARWLKALSRTCG